MTNRPPDRDYSQLSREQLEAYLNQADFPESERERVKDELVSRIRDELLQSAEGRKPQPKPQKPAPKASPPQSRRASPPQRQQPPPAPAQPIPAKKEKKRWSTGARLLMGFSIVAVLGVLCLAVLIFALYTNGANGGGQPTYGTTCRTDYGVCQMIEPAPRGSPCFCPNTFTGFNDPGVVE